MSDQSESRTRFESLSDGELISATRNGEREAFGVLWERHARAGEAAARAITDVIEPADLVAESFTSILATIERGGGPDGPFRPYLYSTIRHMSISLAKKHRLRETGYLEDLLEMGAEDDETIRIADRTTVAKAFKSLPERWRTVLWYVEVDGMKLAEVAALMGMTPNAVGVLAFRAREGFRKAWIQAHVNEATRPPECQWASDKMAARRLGSLPVTEKRRFKEHVDGCIACAILYEEIDEVAGRLPAVLIVLALGGVAGAAYLAAKGDPRSPVSSSSNPYTPASAATSATSAAASSSPAAPVLITVAALALAGAAAWAGLGLLVPTADLGEPPAVAQSPVPTEPPTPSPSPTTDPPTQSEEPTTPPAPPGPAPTISPDPDPAPGDTTALPPVVDPFTVDYFLPQLSGTAEPGATLTITAAPTGLILTAVADGTGAWSVDVPADAVRQSMTLTATQTDTSGNGSQPTVIGPVTFLQPTLTAFDGSTTAHLTDEDVDGLVDDILVYIGGVEGMDVVVAIDGSATGHVHRLLAAPLPRYVADIAPGVHVLEVRYIDEDSGVMGAPLGVEFVVAP